jgi:hypothetical protein
MFKTAQQNILQSWDKIFENLKKEKVKKVSGWLGGWLNVCSLYCILQLRNMIAREQCGFQIKGPGFKSLLRKWSDKSRILDHTVVGH